MASMEPTTMDFENCRDVLSRLLEINVVLLEITPREELLLSRSNDKIMSWDKGGRIGSYLRIETVSSSDEQLEAFVGKNTPTISNYRSF
ncbi:hypothetical protein SETIT_8G227000v2 [Setaria italica]|uniref:Uncharacterized protein n=2 Tax=Setaria TaxID=4554 RepID=A0A368SAS6_SETIT|nr:hypothetical protein SETIT_8G227000v2 [Setaria italica]